MKTTHTPAPWKILWGNYTHFATINKDANKRICAIDIKDNREIEEATANVNLLRAAPELLAALKEVRQWYEENHEKYLGTYAPVCFSSALSAIQSAES